MGMMNGYFLLSCTIYLFTTTARAHTKAIRSTVRKYNVGEELYMDSINNSSMLELLKRIWRVSCDIKGRRHTTVNGAVLQLICTYSYIQSLSHYWINSPTLSTHGMCNYNAKRLETRNISFHSQFSLSNFTCSNVCSICYKYQQLQDNQKFFSVQQKILIWIKQLHSIP